jgi:bifunctional lysine-specific demethylase and histidyl-hydroxylase MINA
MIINDFASLLAPFPADKFLSEYKGRNWLHIQGPADRVDGMLDWDVVSTLLNMEIWNHQTLLLVQDTQPIPAHAYCRQRIDRTGQRQLVPDPRMVEQHLGRGASLVLNEVESLVPAIRRIVDAFTSGLGAKSSGNAYISQKNHQAFDSHYDKTDVFALQTFGSKRWRIYEGQIEAPVIHARFAGITKPEIERLKGKVEAEFIMRPGDLLYLPRGRFHDALATEGPSMHMSFAVSEPKGLDILQIVMDEAVGDPLFRMDLPLDQDAVPDYLDELADHLRTIALSERTKERSAALRGSFAPPRPEFRLGRRDVQ